MASAWETRFSDFVKRVMGLRESTVLDPLPDLMPVLVVNDPRSPDMLGARNEYLYSLSLTATGAAGQFGTVWVSVTNDNVLSCIDTLVLCTATTQVVVMEMTVATAPPADVGTTAKETLDKRFEVNGSGFTPLTRIAATSEAAVVPSQEAGVFFMTASQPLVLPVRMVLGGVRAAGDSPRSLRIQAQTVATQIAVSVYGVERHVNNSEIFGA